MLSFLSISNGILKRDVVEGSPLGLKISNSFMNMGEFLPLKSVEHLDLFFSDPDYSSSEIIDTFYGPLQICPISKTILKLFKSDNCTLERISALNVAQTPYLRENFDQLLMFRESFVTFILTVYLFAKQIVFFRIFMSIGFL